MLADGRSSDGGLVDADAAVLVMGQVRLNPLGGDMLEEGVSRCHFLFCSVCKLVQQAFHIDCQKCMSLWVHACRMH